MSHERPESLFSVSEDPPEETEDSYTRPLRWRVFEGVGELFYPVRDRLGLDASSKYANTLVGAEITTPPNLYLAAALGTALITGFLAGIGGAALAVTLLGTPTTLTSQHGLLTLMSGLSPLLTVFFGIYAFFDSYPRIIARRRARDIDLGLSDLVSFMYSVAISGMNIVEVLQAAAETETEYGEASREFQRMVQRMNIVGEDYRAAIEHVRDTTPSDDLAQFLTSLLSVLDSGGDIQRHLEREKDAYLEEAERAQEAENDLIELLGQVYMVAKLAPILLLIMYVIIMFSGQSGAFPLLMLVYVLMPVLAFGYLVVLATITADKVGEGRIEIPGRDVMTISSSWLATPVLDSFAADNPSLFEQAQAKERQYQVRRLLRDPVSFWKERPRAVLWVTIPLTVITLGVLLVIGEAVVSLEAFIANQTRQTVIWVYLPLFINLLPLAIFYEWNSRERRAIKDSLTQDLWKLGETNRHADSLRDAFKELGASGESKLSQELGRIETNRQFGIPIEASIVDLANRYEEPRFARIMKIIQKAQEADQQISEVLDTAAELSKIQDTLEEDRRARTQHQATIVGFSFLVFIVIVMILMVFFQPLVAGAAQDGQQATLNLSVDPNLMATIYLHALVIDAIGTGAVMGYIRTMEVAGAFKYILVTLVIALLAWLSIPPLIESLGVIPSV